MTPATRFMVAVVGALAAAVAPAADHQDWPLLGRNADMQHNSPLQVINDKNVANLGLAWVAEMPTKDGLVGNVLVVDGIAADNKAVFFSMFGLIAADGARP